MIQIKCNFKDMIDNEEKSKIKAYLLKIRTDHFYQLKNFHDNPNIPKYQFSEGDRMYFLGLKGSKALNDITDILLRDPSISANYSRRTMTRELQRLIAKISNSQPRGIEKFCKESLETFLKELENQTLTSWEIITPVINLLLSRDTLQVGKVMFRKNNEQILEKFKDIAKKTNSLDDVKNYISDELIPRFNNKVLAFVTIEAKDKHNALDLGHKEIDRALNVLRFYSRGTQKNDSISYRMFIAREGLIYHGLTLSIFSNRGKNNTTSRFDLHFDHTGYLYEYHADEYTIGKMNSLSFSIIKEILLKNHKSLTDFEKKILDAIEFFGIGMFKTNLCHSFLNFIISLELLLTNKWEPQKGLIAERVAILIAEEVNERKELFSEIERLYQLRSDLIHQGEDSITDLDLSILSYIVFQVIVALIPLTKGMQKFADLVEKFNTSKFSHPFV